MNRVFGSWGGGLEEVGSCGLWRDNCWRGNFMDFCLDGWVVVVVVVVGVDFRREDLFEVCV